MFPPPQSVVRASVGVSVGDGFESEGAPNRTYTATTEERLDDDFLVVATDDVDGHERSVGIEESIATAAVKDTHELAF